MYVYNFICIKNEIKNSNNEVNLISSFFEFLLNWFSPATFFLNMVVYLCVSSNFHRQVEHCYVLRYVFVACLYVLGAHSRELQASNVQNNNDDYNMNKVVLINWFWFYIVVRYKHCPVDEQLLVAHRTMLRYSLILICLFFSSPFLDVQVQRSI